MVFTRTWPATADELRALQREPAAARPGAWSPPTEYTIGGCFVCFARGTGARAAAVEAYARRGLLPSVKLGRHRRSIRSDVERAIVLMQSGPTA